MKRVPILLRSISPILDLVPRNSHSSHSLLIALLSSLACTWSSFSVSVGSREAEQWGDNHLFQFPPYFISTRSFIVFLTCENWSAFDRSIVCFPLWKKNVIINVSFLFWLQLWIKFNNYCDSPVLIFDEHGSAAYPLLWLASIMPNDFIRTVT